MYYAWCAFHRPKTLWRYPLVLVVGFGAILDSPLFIIAFCSFLYGFHIDNGGDLLYNRGTNEVEINLVQPT